MNNLRPTILLLASVLLCGCSGPMWIFPGGSLGDEDVSFSEAPATPSDILITLETRPDDPYSVYINAFAVDGVLHIDPTPERTWGQHLADDPLIRVRLGDDPTIYRASALAVTDQAVLDQFEEGRIVYRIGAR